MGTQLKKKSKVRITWKDFYHNITKQSIADLREKAAQRFGLNLSDVEIKKEYIQKLEKDSKALDLVTENVLNLTKLKEQYVNFLKNDDISSEDIEKFFILDSMVMEQIPKTIDDYDTRDRSYKILFFRGKNIFSFGDFERRFDSDSGINLIHSNPHNQGGKSSLSRMPAILLFGNKIVYGHKRATYDKVFNKYVKDKEAFIEGEIEIAGEIYYIRRDLKRGRTGKVTHKLMLFRYDENAPFQEKIGRNAEDLRSKDATKSLKKFEKHIGTYDDYVFASYYEYHNIEKWLQTTKKQRYRLFCEYLGLGLLEEKWQIANKMRNVFLNKSLISTYNIEDVKKEITELNAEMKVIQAEQQKASEIYLTDSEQFALINENIQKKIKSRLAIDKGFDGNFSVENINKQITRLEQEITEVTASIKMSKSKLAGFASFYEQPAVKVQYKKQLSDQEKLLKTIVVPQGMRYALKVLKKELEQIVLPQSKIESLDIVQQNILDTTAEIKTLSNEISRIEQQLEKLPEYVSCSKCGNVESTVNQKIKLKKSIEESEQMMNAKSRSLDNLKYDKSKMELENANFLKAERNVIQRKITEQEQNIEDFREKRYNEIQNKISETQKIISNFNDYRNTKAILANQEDKINNLKESALAKKKIIENYMANREKIEWNRKLKLEIGQMEVTRDELQDKLRTIQEEDRARNTELNLKEFQIKQKRELIEKLRKDYVRERIFRLYLKVHSEEGLSKHIILSILPHINANLAQLMSGVCDFELFIEFTDKEIKFTFERNGKRMDLSEGSGYEITASCLALHHVNVRMTNLPISNNLILDEVLGRVSKENIPKLVKIVKKLCEIFQSVDIITHSHGKEMRKFFDSEILVIKDKATDISKIAT